MPASERPSGINALKAMLWGSGTVILLIIMLIIFSILALNFFRVDVPTFQMAILIKKTGLELDNDQEVAPSAEYKGVQREFLLEGKQWRDPYNWDWKIIPQQEVPHGKMGVLISLVGDDLPYGEFLARLDPKVDEKQILQGAVQTKGIVPGVLNEGRYPIHPYLFELETHDPIVVDAGYRGVVTNLAGKMPAEANTLLVKPGERGVQEEALDAGTYYMNPYEFRINKVDCRSQKYQLAENKDMGFPTKDGFWVTLDGVIEFRVMPESAAEVYVTFNDDENGEMIDEEIIRKVIMPIARSYCRTEGSKLSGREFIQGETRSKFEELFQTVMRKECEPLGIEVVLAQITDIFPPQQIAEPIRERGLAKEERGQFLIEIDQQVKEQELAVKNEMKERKQELIKAEQEVVKMTTEALREQEVAIIKANENLEVATYKLKAAADEAEAIKARGQADADVVRFQNEAEAAGWKRSVEAFGGDGNAFAKYILNQKLAPAYQKIMANTGDSPIMSIFESFAVPSQTAEQPAESPATPAAAPATAETTP